MKVQEGLVIIMPLIPDFHAMFHLVKFIMPRCLVCLTGLASSNSYHCSLSAATLIQRRPTVFFSSFSRLLTLRRLLLLNPSKTLGYQTVTCLFHNTNWTKIPHPTKEKGKEISGFTPVKY